MQTIAYRKTYISLVVLITPNGVKQPLKIRWTDGQTYAIDKIIDVCKAASTKVGGCGTRYTVRIEGKETYLFDEDVKWFVEEEYIKEV